VDRGLGVDVGKGKNMIILKQDFSLDFPAGDPAEKTRVVHSHTAFPLPAT
jgi:hypothetical protein